MPITAKPRPASRVPAVKKAAVPSKAAPSPRNAKLLATMAKVNKKLGPGTMMLASDIDYESMPRITSGSLALDVILGGGWPAGQWHELYGRASSGKTAVALQTLAVNQQLDPDWWTLWIASETFEKGWALKNGVDMSRVMVFSGNVMEQSYQTVLDYVEEAVDMVVIDSLPALVPLREDEALIGDVEPGLGARRTNSFFRKLGEAADHRGVLLGERRPTTIFVINQPRMMIGGWSPHGTPETTPGGMGKDFAYFCRLHLSRVEWIKDGKIPVGQTIRARTEKNKSNAPYKAAEVDFYIDRYTDKDGRNHEPGRFDTLKEITSIGLAIGVITGSGHYYYEGEKLCQGKDNIPGALASRPDLQAAITEAVMRIIHQDPSAYQVREVEDDEL